MLITNTINISLRTHIFPDDYIYIYLNIDLFLIYVCNIGFISKILENILKCLGTKLDVMLIRQWFIIIDSVCYHCHTKTA